MHGGRGELNLPVGLGVIAGGVTVTISVTERFAIVKRSTTTECLRCMGR
jgi:hypothetical protein